MLTTRQLIFKQEERNTRGDIISSIEFRVPGDSSLPDVQEEFRRFLQAVGFVIREEEEDCCGFGEVKIGSYDDKGGF